MDDGKWTRFLQLTRLDCHPLGWPLSARGVLTHRAPAERNGEYRRQPKKVGRRRGACVVR